MVVTASLISYLLFCEYFLWKGKFMLQGSKNIQPQGYEVAEDDLVLTQYAIA